MTVAIVNGWLEVPYDGDDRATIEISVDPARLWASAFLDYTDGVRVAKIRLPLVAQTSHVWLRVNGSATPVGWLRPNNTRDAR